MLKIEPFFLKRNKDVSGVSGEGVVCVGAIFPSGDVVVNWLSLTPSLGIYRNLQHLQEVHGHAGDTEIIMGHPDATPKKRAKKPKTIP